MRHGIGDSHAAQAACCMALPSICSDTPLLKWPSPAGKLRRCTSKGALCSVLSCAALQRLQRHLRSWQQHAERPHRRPRIRASCLPRWAR